MRPSSRSSLRAIATSKNRTGPERSWTLRRDESSLRPADTRINSQSAHRVLSACIEDVRGRPVRFTSTMPAKTQAAPANCEGPMLSSRISTANSCVAVISNPETYAIHSRT